MKAYYYFWFDSTIGRYRRFLCSHTCKSISEARMYREWYERAVPLPGVVIMFPSFIECNCIGF